jgi:hypothetical protein
MIKVLEALLNKISSKHPGTKPAPSARPKRSSSAGNFHAVSIAPSLICCPAAMQAAERPYLSREAPRLPLQACTMPKNCSCKFRKNSDRRGSDRRLFGTTETSRWFVGSDNRKRGCRRAIEQ